MKYVIPTHRVVQCFSAFAASLGGLCVGTVIAWSSAVNYLPRQNDQTETLIEISKEDLPLAAAMLNLGALAFAIPSGKLADGVGRTPTILFAMVLFLLNWIMIAFAEHLAIVVIGRFIGGMAVGASCVVCNMYSFEIADNHNRALLVSGFGIFLALGLVFMNSIALFVGWQEYNLLPATFPIIFALCFLVLPESPTFLVSKGERNQTRKSLMRLRKKEETENELLRIEEAYQKTNKQNSLAFTELFTVKSNLHSLVATVGVLMFQQLSNVNTFNYYADSIFAAAAFGFAPPLSTVIMNSVHTIVLVPSLFVLKKANRKLFLLLSASTITISHLGLAIYFHIKENNIEFPYMGFIPVALLMLYGIGFSFGFATIPWVLSSELFKPTARGCGSGIAEVSNWSTAFVVTYFFPIMLDKLGTYQIFYIFSGVGICWIIFIKFVVPETESRSFLVIRES